MTLERPAAVKRLLFALTLAALLACAALAQTAQPDSKKAPAQAEAPKREELKVIPDEVFNQELKDLEGRSFFLSNYRGQVFVINVWASWCGPCRYEIPELKKAYKKFSGRGVEFIGLTVDNPQTDAEQVRTYLKVMKINYKLGWINGPTLDKLVAGRLAIPQTFVVAADGRIVWHVVGFVGRDKEQQLLGDNIEKALNPAPAQ